LPHVQKLYDRIKDRKDVQLVTFNIDDSIGLIAPFLKKNNYTFPVVPAEPLVNSLIPMLTIPTNWIVDTDGVVRLERIGFGADEKWADQAIETIEKARAGG
jgi:hypothetical protein